jgi:3-isopropylmalate/(R)-2-methylmalate dehydratase small subunit
LIRVRATDRKEKTMASTSETIKGTVYVVDDNIDTDQIIPAKFLNLVPTIPDEYARLGSHAMAGLPESYSPFVPEGEMKTPYVAIIAGRNFGCGSSREHAPICLGAAGIQAVVAESYARIFFRNSVATGEVFPLESELRLCDIFQTGDEIEIDITEQRVTRVATGESFELKPSGAVAPVIEAGGIFGYARATGMIKQKD